MHHTVISGYAHHFSISIPDVSIYCDYNTLQTCFYLFILHWFVIDRSSLSYFWYRKRESGRWRAAGVVKASCCPSRTDKVHTGEAWRPSPAWGRFLKASNVPPQLSNREQLKSFVLLEKLLPQTLTRIPSLEQFSENLFADNSTECSESPKKFPNNYITFMSTQTYCQTKSTTCNLILIKSLASCFFMWRPRQRRCVCTFDGWSCEIMSW